MRFINVAALHLVSSDGRQIIGKNCAYRERNSNCAEFCWGSYTSRDKLLLVVFVEQFVKHALYIRSHVCFEPLHDIRIQGCNESTQISLFFTFPRDVQRSRRESAGKLFIK